MHDVTRILEAVRQGDREAAEALLPATYRELRGIAQRLMAGERDGHTLQPTALVHEAYLRLAGGDGEQPEWESRGHFFTAVAEAMRRVLIDSARRRQSQKRGGDRVQTAWEESKFETRLRPDELLALDEALGQLEGKDPQAAQVVKLRYFAGMTVAETAVALGLSPRTVDRIWKVAKGWLFRELSRE